MVGNLGSFCPFDSLNNSIKAEGSRKKFVLKERGTLKQDFEGRHRRTGNAHTSDELHHADSNAVGAAGGGHIPVRCYPRFLGTVST